MPKASEVAAELRCVADALDKEPEAEVRKAHLLFTCSFDKELFMNLARLLPKPLAKKYDEVDGPFSTLAIEYETSGIWIRASVYRSAVCKILRPAQPAEYECEPLLTLAEEAAFQAQEG